MNNELELHRKITVSHWKWEVWPNIKIKNFKKMQNHAVLSKLIYS